MATDDEGRIRLARTAKKFEGSEARLARRCWVSGLAEESRAHSDKASKDALDHAVRVQRQALRHTWPPRHHQTCPHVWTALREKSLRDHLVQGARRQRRCQTIPDRTFQ